MNGRYQRTPEEIRRRKIARKKKRTRRRILTELSIIAAFLLGIAVGKKLPEEKGTLQQALQGEIHSLTSDIEDKEEQPCDKREAGMQTGLTLDELSSLAVEKPKKLTRGEAITILTQKATEDERYSQVLEKESLYPDEILVNLANNPEQISFAVDYPGENLSISEGLTEDELAQKCPLFLQWDKRWGYHEYGDESTIAVSGCGPTSLAMVVVGLTHDASVTPQKVADFAMNNDFYMYGTGTMWSLMTDGAAYFGLDSTQIDIDKDQMEACLNQNGMLICSLKSGDFTTAGHFIVIYGIEDGDFLVNDPFCVYRSSQSWSYDTLQPQLKSVWAVYANGSAEKVEA